MPESYIRELQSYSCCKRRVRTALLRQLPFKLEGGIDALRVKLRGKRSFRLDSSP